MKNDLSDPRDVALRRFEMIAPLLEPDLEPAEKALRREAILASQEAKGEPISTEPCGGIYKTTGSKALMVCIPAPALTKENPGFCRKSYYRLRRF